VTIIGLLKEAFLEKTNVEMLRYRTLSHIEREEVQISVVVPVTAGILHY